jgi:hypothetical protein
MSWNLIEILLRNLTGTSPRIDFPFLSAENTSMAGLAVVDPSMAEVMDFLREQRDQIAILTNSREVQTAESAVLKAQLEALKTQQGSLASAEYQSVMSAAENMFPAPEFFANQKLGPDMIMLQKMQPMKDYFTRARAVYAAITKDPPDIPAAKKFMGESIRLMENQIGGLHASAQLKRGPERYNGNDFYGNLMRPYALAEPPVDWQPQSIIQIDAKELKRAREMAELSTGEAQGPSTRPRYSNPQPPQQSFNHQPYQPSFSGGGRGGWGGGGGRGQPPPYAPRAPPWQQRSKERARSPTRDSK